MKIGIVTLYGLENYGNRLQNFELQKYLESLDIDVETIVVKRKEGIIKSVLKKILRKYENNRIRFIPICELVRKSNFALFNMKYVKTKYIYSSNGKIPEIISKRYDLFIAGSDQIWNPTFWEQGKDSSDLYNYMLKFTQPDKRIAYAASFGISSIPNEWKYGIAEGLSGFLDISVRELEARNIIYGLVNKKYDIVVDPTMLVDINAWRMIETDISQYIKDEYILTYFLGEKEEKTQNFINVYAKKNNIKIIDLMDESDIAYRVGPDKFLTFIDNASFVFTDSFHATVFSLLFNTKFVVFNRNHSSGLSMLGRIKTLLESVKMEDRIDMYNFAEIDNCEFKYVNEYIKTMQLKSRRHIEKILFQKLKRERK